MAALLDERVACCRFLSRLYRHSLKDSYFGDEEVFWTEDSQGQKSHLAGGYFGSSASVAMLINDEWKKFEGDDARTFRYVGRKGRQEWN